MKNKALKEECVKIRLLFLLKNTLPCQALKKSTITKISKK